MIFSIERQPAMRFSDLRSCRLAVDGSLSDFFYSMRDTTAAFRLSQTTVISNITEKFFVIRCQISACDKKMVLPEDIRHLEDDYTQLSEMLFDLQKDIDFFNQQPRSANMFDEESTENTPEGE